MAGSLTEVQAESDDFVVASGLVQTAGVENAAAYGKWLQLTPTASSCKMTSVASITSEYTIAPKGF